MAYAISPSFAWNSSRFHDGDDALNADELMLIECYDRLGRPDLGFYVANGRRYQRLFSSMGVRAREYSMLVALRRTMLGPDACAVDMSYEEWTTSMVQVHGEDPAFKLAVEKYPNWFAEESAGYQDKDENGDKADDDVEDAAIRGEEADV